jgi:hypothetical protein
MKALGFLVGIPVAILTWYLTVMIAGGLMIASGRHPDMYGVAPFAVIIAGPVFGILAWRRTIRYFEKLEREDNQRRQEAAWRREAEARQQEQKRALTLRLSALISNSTDSAARLPVVARSAETSLDRAEAEFKEGAFAPFWDAVEDAANDLARFDLIVRGLIQNFNEYKAESPNLDSPPPPFEVGVHVLPDASRTADRMRGIVRRAQKNFEFATIYEQRKTNQLLVAGFSSLAHAINDLGNLIDSSLQSLAACISISIAEVASAQRETASQLAAELQLSREQSLKDSDARREHERQQLKMLDNIQHRKKP